jgi:hypothetical protein
MSEFISENLETGDQILRNKIEKSIRETLVIENSKSIKYAVNKIISVINENKNLDLNELKSMCIQIVRDAVKDDKDCSTSVIDKALSDLSHAIDRLDKLIGYSKERISKIP